MNIQKYFSKFPRQNVLLIIGICSFFLMAVADASAQRRGSGGGGRGGGGGGMGPEAMGVIQSLSNAERQEFFSLSKPERRNFIQDYLRRQNEAPAPTQSTQNEGDNSMENLNPRMPREIQEKAGLFNTGVEAIYPSDANCAEVKSFFGDQTRYDGSSRTPRFYQGYHEGFDISLPDGTPLVALADGEVVHKFSGARLVGNQIYIRHTPEDTGVPVYIYSKYKHFNELPDVNVGDRVKMGQLVGYSGKTGTTGGHFGSEGYPHLHLSIYVSQSGEYKSERIKISPKGVRYFDPLALYLMKDTAAYDNHAVRNLPQSKKKVVIPYKKTDGSIVPASTRFIWPVMCKSG